MNEGYRINIDLDRYQELLKKEREYDNDVVEAYYVGVKDATTKVESTLDELKVLASSQVTVFNNKEA